MTSAITPPDSPVLHGCLAFARHLHAAHFDASAAILLLATVRDDDHELNEDEVMQLLGLSRREDALMAMGRLFRKGLAELHEDRDFPAYITLTQDGELAVMAMLGAVLLSASAVY